MESTNLFNIINLKKSNLSISNHNKDKLLKKIIIFSLIIIVLLGLINIYLILNINNKKEIIKKLKEENPFYIENKDTTITYNKNESYKGIPENILKYQNEIKLEYYKIQELINNHNYTIKDNIENFIKKLENFLTSESDVNNSNDQSQVFVMNNNYNSSKIKNQYYIRIDNAFDKYRNETELTDEYKNKFKQDILNGYSSLFNKDYKNIDTIIFDKNMNFGNAMYVINNLIYYCELLGCKNIYISKEYWFIKKPIYDNQLNLTISPFDRESYNIQNENSTILLNNKITFDNTIKLFNDNFIPVRTYLLKDELFSNLKLINTSSQDLYINIRSGEDVFDKKWYAPASYYQPPLCFYEFITETFNFTNIYIISNGKENPVINKLEKRYNITYMHGTVEEDAAMILSAKNLVLSTSSFPIELIKFSNNLQNLFVFDFMEKNEKIFWHFTERHLRPLKFNMFIMYPTKEYIEIMAPWKKDQNQYDQMIIEKCNKKLTLYTSDFL